MVVTDEFTPMLICLDVLSGNLQRFVELEIETSPITASCEYIEENYINVERWAGLHAFDGIVCIVQTQWIWRGMLPIQLRIRY